MKANHLRRQRTIKVKLDGKTDTIKMIVRRVTSQANFIGWRVNVNNEVDWFCSFLTLNEVYDWAFARYIKNYR